MIRASGLDWRTGRIAGRSITGIRTLIEMETTGTVASTSIATTTITTSARASVAVMTTAITAATNTARSRAEGTPSWRPCCRWFWTCGHFGSARVIAAWWRSKTAAPTQLPAGDRRERCGTSGPARRLVVIPIRPSGRDDYWFLGDLRQLTPTSARELKLALNVVRGSRDTLVFFVAMHGERY